MIDPRTGRSARWMLLSIVVLLDPFGPMMPTNDPDATAIVAS
nr:hypothetical protein [Agreia sp. Leaf335]